MFSTDTDRAEDVSHAIAQEILRRLGLEGRNLPSVLEDFIDRHVGGRSPADVTTSLAGSLPILITEFRRSAARRSI